MCGRFWRDIKFQEACKDMLEVPVDIYEILPNFNVVAGHPDSASGRVFLYYECESMEPYPFP